MSTAVANASEAAEPAQRAFGSSFYTAMRILPRAQREAMFEVYSFCRAVDDIADDVGPRSRRVDQLQQWRFDIEQLYAGAPRPGLVGLARAVRAFDLRREDFLAVIDGMEMDVVTDMCAPDHMTLDLYCDRVACAVGRLSVRIFGLEQSGGQALAHHLGRALQLTNILRDLDEDAALGRLYLPREALQDSGIQSSDPMVALAHPGIGRVCSMLVERANMHFRKADEAISRCPRRSVRAPRIMAAVYRTILARLVERGFAPPRAPVRVGRLRLLWIVMRSAIG